MKKILLSIVCAAASLCASAGLPAGIFDHVGVGVGVGTTGITIEAATPITRWVQMRAGVSIMPGIKFGVDSDVDYTVNENGYIEDRTSEVELKGNLKRVQGQVIFNAYPIPGSGFFVAAGAYFGGADLLKITGHCDDLAGLRTEDGYVTVGDYKIPVDPNGDVRGGIKVNSFRPYVGLGFGRSVPGKLLSFTTELGLQFHGKPKLYTDYGELDLSEVDDDDTFQKIMDKVKVYPTLTFRLNFRAF